MRTTITPTPSTDAVRPMRRHVLVATGGAALGLGTLLAGCGTPRGSGPSGPSSTPGGAPMPSAGGREAGLPAALVNERDQLQEWFKGTPVRIGFDGDVLRVDVPLQYAFKTGATRIEPPLAKVIERVVVSLRRAAQARVQVVATTDVDRVDGGNLALNRAGAVVDQLLRGGINAVRIDRSASSTNGMVSFRVSMPN